MDRSSSTKSADRTNLSGKRKREPNYESETKPTLKKHKERSDEKDTTQGFAENLLHDVKGRIQLLETKSEANLIPVKETVEGLDETPHFVEGVSVRKNTLIIGNLSCHARVPNMVNFFKDVGKVVHVRRIVNYNGKCLGYGSVEFASPNEAKKALEKKNGEYLCGKNITLGFAKTTHNPQRPGFCIEHKVWHEDDIRRESFSVEEEEEMRPHFFEAARKKTIFLANLSPQTKMIHIIKFFQGVGEVFSVRLIVNQEGKHVGYGFVEFTNAYNAKKALEKKNGEYLLDHKIFLDGAKTTPCSPRPKYSPAEKLWYEDYLLRESLLIEEDETLKGHDETPNFVEAVAVREKTLFIHNLVKHTKISDIINFFKDVVEVVHVRLIVDRRGKHVGYGFVEFASADEAKKAQEEKNGEYLGGNPITLSVVKIAPYPPPCMYCIDHKVWYEDYLRGESRLIEEDEAVEGLDEFVEEVSSRKKTLFIENLPRKSKIRDIARFFQEFGEVSVRLLVDYNDKHLGCCFVKFASDIEAKKALVKKNQRLMSGHFIFLQRAKIAPYPLRPKYNQAEKLWYEDYLQRKRLWKEEESLKKQFCGKKITFYDDDDWQIKMNLFGVFNL